jgi:phage terminase small subunit
LRRILSSITPKPSLSERERRFVDAYMGDAQGNGTAAARLAGYKGNAKVLGVQSTRLLTKANIQAAVTARRVALDSQSIADAKERREILTAIIRNGQQESRDRIRAIDVANKMDGIYIEKHELTASVPLFAMPDGAMPSVSKQERE